MRKVNSGNGCIFPNTVLELFFVIQRKFFKLILVESIAIFAFGSLFLTYLFLNFNFVIQLVGLASNFIEVLSFISFIK